MPVKPLLVVFGALPLVAGAVAAQEACPGLMPDTPTVKLAGVDAAGDPVLSDGRRLRLIGLSPRQDAEEARRFAAGIAYWSGRALDLIVLGGPDRWNRLPARLLTVGEAPEDDTQDLAVALLQSGAAARMAEPGHGACDALLRAAFATPADASSTRAGGTAAIDAQDLATLKAREGRLILLEGRIASVSERAQRTYVNFSRRRGEAASIVLSAALWRDLKAAGWTASGLGGKRLRARGILSGRDGLLLDVTSRLALELID